MRYQEDKGPPVCSMAILVTFFAFFYAQWNLFDTKPFHAYPWRIADGQFYRLITATFMHGSVLHIMFNAIMFFRCAVVIENWLGPWGALLGYVIFATSSTAAQLLCSGAPMIGASGVVYAMFGFLWVLSRRRDDAATVATKYMVEYLLGFLVVCFVVNQLGGNIGNTAHIYGLFTGWMVGQCFIARKATRWWKISLTVVVWALPVALTYRPIWETVIRPLPILGKNYLYREELKKQVWEDLTTPVQPGLIGL